MVAGAGRLIRSAIAVITDFAKALLRQNQLAWLRRTWIWLGERPYQRQSSPVNEVEVGGRNDNPQEVEFRLTAKGRRRHDSVTGRNAAHVTMILQSG